MTRNKSSWQILTAIELHSRQLVYQELNNVGRWMEAMTWALNHPDSHFISRTFLHKVLTILYIQSKYVSMVLLDFLPCV